MFRVLQIGQFSKLSPVLLHSSHTHRCPQLQNKILGGLVRHKTHLSSLKVFGFNYFFIRFMLTFNYKSKHIFIRTINLNINIKKKIVSVINIKAIPTSSISLLI